VLEKAASYVVETCWFKKKITPIIAKVDFVRTLPAKLAEFIIKHVKTLLPDSLQDVFADIDTSPQEVTKDDIDCEADELERQQDAAVREAMYELVQAVGEGRVEAFGRLSQKFGIPDNEPVTPEQINRIKTAILDSGLTVDEMNKYADEYPKVSDPNLVKRMVPMETFLHGVKSATAAPKPPAPGGSVSPPATGEQPAPEATGGKAPPTPTGTSPTGTGDQPAPGAKGTAGTGPTTRTIKMASIYFYGKVTYPTIGFAGSKTPLQTFTYQVIWETKTGSQSRIYKIPVTVELIQKIDTEPGFDWMGRYWVIPPARPVKSDKGDLPIQFLDAGERIKSLPLGQVSKSSGKK
jgi:hypothetical protein